MFYGLIEEKQFASYDREEATGEVKNEAEKRTIFRALGPLRKLHNIVIHIRGSIGRRVRFRELAKRLIPLNNRTKWNSWYAIL